MCWPKQSLPSSSPSTPKTSRSISSKYALSLPLIAALTVPDCSLVFFAEGVFAGHALPKHSGPRCRRKPSPPAAAHHHPPLQPLRRKRQTPSLPSLPPIITLLPVPSFLLPEERHHRLYRYTFAAISRCLLPCSLSLLSSPHTHALTLVLSLQLLCAAGLSF